MSFVLPFVIISCSDADGWSEQERALINGATLSGMEVVTIDNVEDSLILRKVSRDLTASQVNSVEFARLVSSMIETVNNPENEGVGIAAPQVGVNVNLIVVQRFDKEGTPFQVYVNPQISLRKDVFQFPNFRVRCTDRVRLRFHIATQSLLRPFLRESQDLLQ